MREIEGSTEEFYTAVRYSHPPSSPVGLQLSVSHVSLPTPTIVDLLLRFARTGLDSPAPPHDHMQSSGI